MSATKRLAAAEKQYRDWLARERSALDALNLEIRDASLTENWPRHGYLVERRGRVETSVAAMENCLAVLLGYGLDPDKPWYARHGSL